MDIIVKSLFNDGYNDGDVTILTDDSEFQCHSFVICLACPTLKTMYEYAKKEKTGDNGHVTMVSDCSTIVIKYLISTLYNHEMDNDNAFLEFVTELKDVVKVDPKTNIETTIKQLSVSSDRLIEYIKARDYYGVGQGERNNFPFTMSVYNALWIIAKLPDMVIYDPLRKWLYDSVYTGLERIDLCDDQFSFVFEDPKMCKEIMLLYNKNVKARRW